MASAGPVTARDRIVTIDIIRGFALFGVLWMNLYEHRGLNMPWDMLNDLPSAWWDDRIGSVSSWLMQGKAQALFSLLFGFGFANIIARLEARGLSAGPIFLRRMAVLLCFGLINAMMMWLGDILVAYSLMGTVLWFTRGWPVRRLLAVGLALTVLGTPVLELLRAFAWGGTFPWDAEWERGAEIRAVLLMQADYPAFVAEMARANWVEWYSQPAYLGQLTQILGRFMIGSAVFHMGWFADIPAHLPRFRRVAAIGLPVGLALSALVAFADAIPALPEWLPAAFAQIATLLLALGYGAGVVLLHAAGRFSGLFAGLGAAGRMALTNYLGQSLFFVLALYGFGLGLMPLVGATLALALAIGFYAVQIGFSLWWLARYRFGPLEWVWRALTYGERPTMRGAAAA